MNIDPALFTCHLCPSSLRAGGLFLSMQRRLPTSRAQAGFSSSVLVSHLVRLVQFQAKGIVETFFRVWVFRLITDITAMPAVVFGQVHEVYKSGILGRPEDVNDIGSIHTPPNGLRWLVPRLGNLDHSPDLPTRHSFQAGAAPSGLSVYAPGSCRMFSPQEDHRLEGSRDTCRLSL